MYGKIINKTRDGVFERFLLIVQIKGRLLETGSIFNFLLHFKIEPSTSCQLYDVAEKKEKFVKTVVLQD